MKNKKVELSVIIIAQNEEEMIGDCLQSVQWADEIIVVDNDSTDKTAQIAKKHQARVIKVKTGGEKNYSKVRNSGLKAAKGDWVFYLDADERVTPELRKEILQVVSDWQLVTRDRLPGVGYQVDHRSPITDHHFTAYAIPRRNFLLGKELHWGGWWPDYVKRLYRRDKLKGWRGKLHEEPIFEGKLGHLKEPMIHFQPDSLELMLEKSIRWAKIEAELLHKAGHPPVVWWRILRMGVTTLFDRLIKKQAFRDGTEGWIEAIYQSFHTMIIYIQLWELQQKKK